MFDDDAGYFPSLSEDICSDTCLNSEKHDDADASESAKTSNSEKDNDIDYHVVTFDSDGGTDVPAQKVKNGEKPFNPGMIVKKSTIDTEYVFIGWYLGSELYMFDVELSSDITLTAKWEIKKYGEPLDF